MAEDYFFTGYTTLSTILPPGTHLLQIEISGNLITFVAYRIDKFPVSHKSNMFGRVVIENKTHGQYK